MSTSTPNASIRRFQYNSYSDFVRTEYSNVLPGLNIAGNNAYWLSAVFQRPWHTSTFILPFEEPGVSILEAVDGHIKLEWSSSFNVQGTKVTATAKDPSALWNAPANLLRRIDRCGSLIQFRVIVIHCFPRGNHGQWQSSDSLPESLALGNLIDTVGARFELKPMFFIEHLAKSITTQCAEWQALPSERDYIRLEHPRGGYITSTLCSETVTSTPTGRYFLP